LNMSAKRDSQGRFLPGESGNPSGIPKGIITYRKAIRLACEKIAAEEGIDDPEEVFVGMIANSIREARNGDAEQFKSLMNRVFGPEIKKEDQQPTNNNIFVISDERRKAIYEIANIHDGQERGNRSLGPGDEGGAA